MSQLVSDIVVHFVGHKLQNLAVWFFIFLYVHQFQPVLCICIVNTVRASSWPKISSAAEVIHASSSWKKNSRSLISKAQCIYCSDWWDEPGAKWKIHHGCFRLDGLLWSKTALCRHLLVHCGTFRCLYVCACQSQQRKRCGLENTPWLEGVD